MARRAGMNAYWNFSMKNRKAIEAAAANKKESEIMATKKNTTTTKKAAKATKTAEAPKVEVVKGTPAQAAKAAEPKPAKKAAAPKAEKKPASTELEIHINKTGRVCFGKVAAARIGDLPYMALAAEGKTVRMLATTKQSDNAVEIRRANKRPYISATRLLKPLGFDGSKALDIIATPYNSHGFEFKVA